jgi:hypothetical protein
MLTGGSTAGTKCLEAVTLASEQSDPSRTHARRDRLRTALSLFLTDVVGSTWSKQFSSRFLRG